MTIRWLLLPAAALPEGDGWLGPEERDVLSRLRFPKRRSEWKLGRFTAKRALALFEGIAALDRIQIVAAKDGAPEAFVDGRRIDSGISISHRESMAACAIAPASSVGCDLEAVEPRSSRFVIDFFTDRERAEVDDTPDSLRDRKVALTWSAKESALKVLRVGLRRDTRSVEVEIDDLDNIDAGWGTLRATVSPEARVLSGWWRQVDDLVLTVIGDDAGGVEDEALALP